MKWLLLVIVIIAVPLLLIVIVGALLPNCSPIPHSHRG
jgi:hypothetical protein